MNDLLSSSSEPTKVDTAASDACTRSGTFALILSVVLVLLIPSWGQRKTKDALGRYLTHRENLSLSLDALDDDPYWQKGSVVVEHKPYKGAMDSLSLAQFLEVRADISAGGSGSDRAQSQSAIPSDNTARGDPTAAARAPAAPTFLSASVDIPEIPVIIDSFRKLNDSSLLAEARGYSNFYNLSISRWAQKRISLANQNLVAGVCRTEELEQVQSGVGNRPCSSRQ